MPFTKEPNHIKIVKRTAKDGTIKEYKYDNKKLNESMKKNNIMIECDCGEMIKKYSKNQHKRSKKHQLQLFKKNAELEKNI